jgi:8-oxo-dGTP pyrophosphatase MutT (NUDIX family)
MESFCLPGVGALITNEVDGQMAVYLQERHKTDSSRPEDLASLIEIPAGKMRAGESVFSCLRREVKEETGLDVTWIEGEAESEITTNGEFAAVSYQPFSCAQSIKGEYPIMVQVFLCRAAGTPASNPEECANGRWWLLSELAFEIHGRPERFYPMHVTTLKRFLQTCGFSAW